jgi:hypothetical protein
MEEFIRMKKVEKPTGIFIDTDEKLYVIQLFGHAHTYPSKSANNILNAYMMMLGKKYKFEWFNHSINPETGEIIYICEDCDDTLPEEDVKIE